MSPNRPPYSMKAVLSFRRLSILAVLFLAAGGAACRLYKLERRLSPAYADFLSKVRYIITAEERKTFLETPDAGKDGFIEGFWARRDPFPESPGNEYKTEYEARIKRASELFLGEGRAGWLTDRGRIYVLFGPPFERLTYPMDASGYCQEVWYYGNFPVLFVDEHCSGQYVLTAINLEHLQMLNIAQGHFQRPADVEKKPFDYTIDIRKIRASEEVYEAAVTLSTPYDRILFVLKKNTFEAAFNVRIELRTQDNKLVLKTEKAFSLSMGQEELTSSRDMTYRMEVPLILEDRPGALRGQKLSLDIYVRINAEGEEVRKSLEFRLEF